MTALSPDTRIALLLTAPLVGAEGDAAAAPLTPSEFKRLSAGLAERELGLASLLEGEAGGLPVSRERLEPLLAREAQLDAVRAVWDAAGIWVAGRADAAYPPRLAERLGDDAPPLLYGRGDPAVFAREGLAIVGSRGAGEAALAFTRDVAALCAEAGVCVVSGGARGVDAEAMRGALEHGGRVSGVMCDSLLRAAKARENAAAFDEGRLLLVSPYDPRAGFNAGHAMQRNKLIYALADAALVSESDKDKGGTWTGSLEQIRKLKFVPVYVWTGPAGGEPSPGRAALIRRGGHAWPDPADARALRALIAGGAPVAPTQRSLFDDA